VRDAAADQLPSDYIHYAEALLTLAHEPIHLGGEVYGVLGKGLAVGDPEAEAKADCYGMQWLGYVATQLGDNPTDAAAIATWVAEVYYPGLENSDNPEYWSADCVPGGRLDIRADKTGASPSGGTAISIPGPPLVSTTPSSIAECWATDQDSFDPADKISRTSDPSPSLEFVTKLVQPPTSDLTATGTVSAPDGSVSYTTSWTWTAQNTSWRFGAQWTNARTGRYLVTVSLGDGSVCRYAVSFTR